MIIPTGKSLLIIPHITTSVRGESMISDYPVWMFWIIGVMFLILNASVIYLTYLMCKDCIESKLAKIFTILFAAPVCIFLFIAVWICFKQGL